MESVTENSADRIFSTPNAPASASPHALPSILQSTRGMRRRGSLPSPAAFRGELRGGIPAADRWRRVFLLAGFGARSRPCRSPRMGCDPGATVAFARGFGAMRRLNPVRKTTSPSWRRRLPAHRACTLMLRRRPICPRVCVAVTWAISAMRHVPPWAWSTATRCRATCRRMRRRPRILCGCRRSATWCMSMPARVMARSWLVGDESWCEAAGGY